MAFILGAGNVVVSFAEYADVTERSQRLFEANEGFTEVNVEDLLEKATGRILNMIRATDWWINYYINQSGNTTGLINTLGSVSVPAVDTTKIKGRTQEFTDLCVYYGLSEYLLPKIADFGNPESAERQMIDFYTTRWTSLFKELIEDGDWYDFDGSGTVSVTEKAPAMLNIRRIR